MKRIALTQGKYALVDDEDFAYLNQWKWYHHQGYAIRNLGSKGKRHTIMMHRIVNNTPNNMETDHVNHNTLDNRKINLRACSHSQNCINRKKYKNKTSPYRGVNWHKSSKKWQAQIKYKGKIKYLGIFNTPEEANGVYQKEAKILFKEFYSIN